MASGWNSESEREATLRRVAIVLSSLPAPIAAHLLGSVEDKSKRDIRRTMTSLADVDPLERQRALRAFKVSVEQAPTAGHGKVARQSPATGPSPGPLGSTSASPGSPPPTSDRLTGASSDSTSRVVSASTVPDAQPWADHVSSNDSPLAFLDQLDEATLVKMLAVEHPQAVALVLASIAPEHAARVVPRLDPKLRADALSRLGRLGEIPEAAAAEIAEHFRSRLDQHSHRQQTSTGRRALDAILAAMPPASDGGGSMGPRDSESAQLSSAVAQWGMNPANPQPGSSDPPPSTTDRESTQPADPYHEPAPVSPASRSESDRFPSADLPAIDLTHKLMAASQASLVPSPADDYAATSEYASSSASVDSDSSNHSPALSETPRSHDLPDRPAKNLSRNPEEIAPSRQPEDGTPFASTDAIHEHLIRLPAAELCRALGTVETRDAILALCGLPNQVTAAALSQLPRAQAKKVRGKMHALGSLSLREIDVAKETVAKASLRMATEQNEPMPVAA